MTQSGKPKAVIFDRDGTLASVAFTKPDEEGHGWDDFNRSIAFDAVVPGVRALLDICNQAPVDTILLSGRDGKYSWEMLTWLGKNGLHVDKFFMRTAGDQRKDDVIKREIYETLIAPFWDVILVVDDRESVCAMWRELGLPLIQVKDPGIVPPIAAHVEPGVDTICIASDGIFLYD